MSSPIPTHPADVLVMVAALQDQVDDLTAVIEDQQRRLDALATTVAARPDRNRP